MARKLANWLKAYMEFTADSESPDDFHFWSGVSTLAGALRRRVWIDMRKFQWTPNFYIILVGPPGIITKSTVMRTGMRLLEQIQGIHFGPPSMTWQALTDSLALSTEYIQLDNKVTGNQDLIPMSCLTIPVSELGTFLKIDDAALVDVLVDLWDGQLSKWGHKTITRGQSDIKNPWLNVIGCTTPSWIKQNVPEHVIGGGLMSRVVFVYGEAKRQLVAYPDEVIPTDEYRRMEENLVADLKEISDIKGAYTLSPEARQWGHDWYAKHWGGSRPVYMASDRYGGYHSRKQTHIHKLAIILSAARSNDMIIRREHLIEAEALLNSSEKHMLKVFESIGMVDEARHVAEIVAFVRAHGFLTSDELFTFVRNVMSVKDYEEAVKAAVRGGLLNVELRDGKRGVVPNKPTTH